LLGETSTGQPPRELVPLPLAAIGALFLLALVTGPQLFAGLRNPIPAEIAITTSAPDPTPSPAPAAAIAAAAKGESVLTAGNGSAGEKSPAASAPDNTEQQPPAPDAAPHKTDYIDGMRAAGYDEDIDKYIAMKVQGITPEYAQAMARIGFGKPSTGDLIAMKVQGVTPEYVSELHAAGVQPANVGDLISYRIFHVTPEFIAGMKAAGFDSIPPGKLIALRVHGVTPEYAKTVKQQYPNATLDELVQLRIFHIDDAFLASAKRHGFTSLSIQKLVQLRISGALDDTVTETK
jgi:hypothetical protein